MDNGLLSHRCIVTTAKGINDRTTHHFQIGLTQIGSIEITRRCAGDNIVWITAMASLIDGMCT